MCDKILHEIEKAREKLSDDYCFQTPAELEQKRRRLQDGGYDEYVSSWPPPLPIRCPRASLYYACTEDINLYDRINEFADAEKKSSGDHVILPHFDPPLDPFTIRDPYEENAAREKYLRTDPVCFAIFGKPGLNSKELAKLISEWWKCVLISPDSLVNEEIEKESDKGQWIEDILLNGGTIQPNVIMNLVEGRVMKNDVKHRGYVVEGLPLIPDNPDPEFSCCPEGNVKDLSEKCCTVQSTCRVNSGSDSSLSQSATSLDSTKKTVSPASLLSLKKLKDTGTKFNLSRDAQKSSSLEALPFLQKATKNVDARLDLFNRPNIREIPQVGNVKTKMRVRINPFDNEARGKDHRFEKCEDYIPHQIEKIFNHWPLKPTVIIYIVCPDEDLIQRQAEFTLNAFAGESLDAEFAETNSQFDDNAVKMYSLNRKSDAKATANFKCEIYKRHALPIIDRYVLKHNPQNVIRVDGRTLITQMFQIVNTKLRTLPFSRAIIPKRIGNRVGWEANQVFAGEGDEEMFRNEFDDAIFEGKDNEEIFQELSNKSTVSSRFRWSLSNWKFTCPVELAQGRTLQGKPENAVRFMNKIFFLSSIEAMEMFVENPRPFLLPMRPKATCKIAIFGPRYSGKTELSYALARNFDANVIDVSELEKRIRDDRIDANVAFAIRKVLPRVIADLRKRLETERKSRELARHQALNFWLSKVKQILKDLDQIQQPDSSESVENSEPLDLTIIHQELQKHGLEVLKEDSKLLRRIKLNYEVLYEYAPEDLRFEESPIRELSEHDPEVAIMLENEVKHLRDEKIEVASSEIAGLLISRIKMMPDVPLDGGLSREPGWILDGMDPDPEIWRILTKAGVCVDDVILINEKQPYANLVDKWKHFNMNEEIVDDEDKDEEEYIREPCLDKEIGDDEDEDEEEHTRESRLDKEIGDDEDEDEEEHTRESRLDKEIGDDEDEDEEEHTRESRLDKEIGDDEDEDEEEYTRESRLDKDIESYISDIREFETNWQSFKVVLEEGGIDPFICNFNKASHMYEIVSKQINDRFRLAAKAITEEERGTELQDSIESGTEIYEDDDLEDEEPEEVGEKKSAKHDNRRLGDTGIYCPVALARYGVLWKGKEEYIALYLDKIYLCSNAEALVEFVENPEIFHVPLKKPMTKIPPARICIVGPPGSGKSTLAKMLSKEFDMKHVDFFARLNTYVHDRGIIKDHQNEDERFQLIDLPEDLTDSKYNTDRETIIAFVQKYKKEGATLPQKMLEECFLNFFRSPHNNFATIFDSFPNCFEDVEIALKNYAVPELVIELECSLEKTRDRLLPALLKSFKNVQEVKHAEAEKSADNTNPEASENEDNPEEEEDDAEEVKDKILQQIEESYHRTSELLTRSRIRMERESISWTKVNGDKDVKTLLPNLRKIIHPLIFRASSTLERTYEINPEIAEDLLECGYFFLSSFGRICPVQMYNRKIPIQLYLLMEDQDKIYTVLHRQYVYFIAGEESLKLFTKDPLKYLLQDSCHPVIPARISIIGPPKCGKSTIAERFSRAYGMRVITQKDALRWTKTNYAWTKTGILINQLEQNEQEITSQLKARAIELYLMDPMSSTQGYVLDGFPSNREEAEELALLNIRPMIVFNLKADENFCLTSSALNDEDKNQNPADYFLSLISHRYDTWMETSWIYLDWLTKFSQNVVDVDATRCKWAVWRNADREFCSRFADVRRYFREADYEKVHCLKNLCVSPFEFRSRQSHYESYCPACLHYEDTIKFSGAPPDRKGVVQFREYFYWICPKHFETFVENPQACLPPESTATLPEELPQILNEKIDLDHVCWSRRLRAGGNCIVTYADALPEYQIVPGDPNLGVLYEDNLYLFSSLECREKFCARPSMYSKIEIKYRETSPSMELRNLPTLDFLEQTVADAVVKALTEAAAVRPKYPGMSPAVSAAVYIGIYLKVHNVDSRRVPVPDARFDYLCEYFKPASKVPAFLNVVDIAGLVKGAAEGQGLGNAFLSHISACDAIFHLCRAFEDDDVTHIEGEVNPVRDLEIISEELRLKDIEFLGVHLEKLEKLVVRGNDKKLKPEYDTVLKVKNILIEEKKHIRFADWSVNEIEILNKYLFLTSKPVIYLVNLSEKDYIRKKNKWLIKIKEWVDKNDPGAIIIPFSGAFENKVIDMDEAERAKYFEESKVTSALDKIIVQGYKALQLQYFFTAGADEVKAWTIQKGTKAPQAAGRIHTDFEKGFIMAEVMKFDDFKNEGSESGVKAAGKYRQQGRNYVVEDGDIIFFKFNAGAGLKDPKKK